MKAKKSYGQHFLTREDITERIANSILNETAINQVVEIGPGKGALTKYLLEKDYTLKCVEADWDMVEYLYRHYPALEGNIKSANFLRIRPEELFEGEFVVIGNFPYNISSQIVFWVLDKKAVVPQMIGMFQKEMAVRIVAAPKSKDYGVISVLTQAFYDGELLFNVDRTCFNPPPKVQSAVIRLTRRENQDIGCTFKQLRQVVKIAFSQRRKMLRNTMKQLIKGHEMLQEPFFMQRPEHLSVQDFIDLTKRIVATREA